MNNPLNLKPSTKDKIVNVVINKLKAEMPGYQPAAIYVSGSRLNRLDSENSDYDIVVFVQSRKIDLLTNTILTKEATIPLKDRKVDLRIYDQRQLYKMLIKSNPSMLELFYEKPIWLSCLYGELYKTLSSKSNWHYLQEVNTQALVSAVGGMLNSERQSILKERNRALKDLSLMAKYLYYLNQIIVDEPINIDMSSASSNQSFEFDIKDLRKLADKNNLTFSRALEYLTQMERYYHLLKDKWSEKNETPENYKHKIEAGKFLKDIFIASI